MSKNVVKLEVEIECDIENKLLQKIGFQNATSMVNALLSSLGKSISQFSQYKQKRSFLQSTSLYSLIRSFLSLKAVSEFLGEIIRVKNVQLTKAERDRIIWGFSNESLCSLGESIFQMILRAFQFRLQTEGKLKQMISPYSNIEMLSLFKASCSLCEKESLEVLLIKNNSSTNTAFQAFLSLLGATHIGGGLQQSEILVLTLLDQIKLEVLVLGNLSRKRKRVECTLSPPLKIPRAFDLEHPNSFVSVFETSDTISGVINNSRRLFGKEPNFQIIGEVGPPHLRSFTVAISIGGKTLAHGTGRSKKKARKIAAHLVLSKMSTFSFSSDIARRFEFIDRMHENYMKEHQVPISMNPLNLLKSEIKREVIDLAEEINSRSQKI